MNIAEARVRFGKQIAKSTGIPENSKIVGLFASVPRESFLGPPPWKIFGSNSEEELTFSPSLLYRDVLVQLRAGTAINNGQPSLHALCFAALNIEPGETVLHVGAGAGYYTAMLGLLVGNSGSVEAYEIDPDLASRAIESTHEMPWIHIQTRSGTTHPLPMCDVLYVSAGATAPLPVWLGALRMGGRLLFPLTPEEGYGGMLLITRSMEGFTARFICRVKFMACEGAHDPRMAQKLTDCFAKGHIEEVRFLRLGNEANKTAWCVGDGWWLSI